ncbi:hypothetical protein E4U55_002546 [Claviceps digitariae]|nr:hypothetical protein E4U55_002546 [Claviceps digitariae]
MSQGAPLEHIDAVDAFARTLFVRVKASPEPLFADVATAVRQLHIALRHLRVEAADPDSLLQSTEASAYARQLRPIIQDCEYALKQLETVLERWSPDASDSGAVPDRVRAVTAARSRLASETMSVDTFLDTVQLHNPANNAPEVLVGTYDTTLEHIKDKVDNIAKGLFLQRDTSGEIIADEDQMWQEFRSKLELDGFSPHVLHRHKDILRAYVRELQFVSAANGGAPPTVRRLLEHEAMMNSSTPPVPPKEPLEPLGPLSPLYAKGSKQVVSGVDDDKHGLSIERDRRLSDHHSSSLVSSHDKAKPSSSSSPDGEKQRSDSSDSLDSLTLISTKDLVAMDDMSSLMANTHLHPAASYHTAAQQIRSSSNLVPFSDMARSWPPPSHLATDHLTTYSMSRSPSASGHQQLAYAPAVSSSPRTAARLAPDRYGKSIPMDALWTKVKRSLVSPEVLERAGVRYEARPDYVAILGRLSRGQLAEYARQSVICRAARSSRTEYPPPRTRVRDYSHRGRAGSKGSRQDHGDVSISDDESDIPDYDDNKRSEKRTKSYSYPYIVSPPSESKTSPSAAVKPKSILKNKNENHVRFAPEPQEMKYAKSPRSYNDDTYDDYYDDNDDDTRGHDGRRENRSRRPRDSRTSGRRDDRGRMPDPRSTRHSDRGDEERRRDRRQERHARRKTWGETIGVVGIGGAAASLLGVLAEAAAGM